MKKRYLFLVASGSGGHILPALQIGKDWLSKNPDGKIIFFASNKNLDKTILENLENIKTIYLNFCQFPGKNIFVYPKFLWQFSSSFIKSVFYILKYWPFSIVSTGGYIAIPVALAGKLFFKKLDLYELNVIPGKAIKFLAPFANKIFVVFNKTQNYFKQKTELIDYPIRFKSYDVRPERSLLEAKSNGYEQNISPKTIFILGGSQGSIYLNNIFKKFLQNIDQNFLSNIEVIHQTGSLDKTDWKTFYKNLNINATIFEYTQNIQDYYQASDLIICRAGAGTLFELKFFNKKALIIPLKTNYTDHQVDNALEIVKQNPKLFKVLTQEEIDKDFDKFEKLTKSML